MIFQNLPLSQQFARFSQITNYKIAPNNIHPNMYHHFTPRNSPSQQTITTKLNQLLNHYQHQKSLKPNNQPNNRLIDSKTSDQFCVSIERSLDNEKNKCMLFWLSNDKLVRYDFLDEVFEEIDGLEDVGLMSIEVLEIGEGQRYLVVGEMGITILSLVREKIDKKPQSQQQAQKKQSHQNQPQRMQQQSNSQPLINKKSQQIAQTFNINKIECQKVFKTYNNILERQQSVSIADKIKHRRFQYAKAFLLKDIGLIEKFQSQEEVIKKEERNRIDYNKRVFAVISFKMAGKSNVNLVVFELTLLNKHQLNNRMNEYSDFTIFTQNLNGQILQITQVQFPNQKHFIQLALSQIQIPFNSQKQSHNINPVEVTQSNAKFSQSNLLIQCDLNFVKPEGSHVAMFSVYYVRQAITHRMEPGEERHYVFQFRIAIDVRECMVVSKQNMWGSPIYEYPQRQFMCPAKVFCLPVVSSTCILNYINVTKTISLATAHKISQWQPFSYKFTTVTMLQDKKLHFVQVEHRINEDQEGVMKRSYRNVLNQEHRRWNVRVDEKIIFGEMIMVDLVQQYAVMVVREEKVKIREGLVPKRHFIGNNGKRNESKIVVINLRQSLESGHKKVCSQFCLGESHDFVNPQIHLKIDSITGNNSLISQELSIQAQVTVINNSLRHNKSLSLTYYKPSKQNEKVKDREFVFEKIDVVPKAIIYCDMLYKLFAKMSLQKGSKGENEIIEEKKGNKGKYSMNGMDTFFATVIDLLEP